MIGTIVERIIEAIGVSKLTASLIISTAAFCMIGTFSFLDEKYRNEFAPLGIVSYEFAGTAESGKAMVNSWDDTQRLYVSFVLGYDFLFMIVYSCAICTSCILAASDENASDWMRFWGVKLAYWQFVAAFFDAIENINLFIGLLYPEDSGIAFPMAAVCASIKFGIVILGILYVLVAIFLRGWKRSLFYKGDNR